MSFLTTLISFRRVLVLLVDLCLIAAAFLLSFLLRFDLTIPASELPLIELGLPVVLLVKPLIFAAFGTYRTIWRYASLQDGLEIAKVVTVSSAASTFGILYLWGFAPYHRSLFIIDGVLLFLFVSGSRLAWRVIRERYILSGSLTGKRTVIVGAGDAGNMLLKEIRKQAESDFHVIGFIDDNKDKQGLQLSGVPVLGGTGKLPQIIRKHAIEEVIIAVPSAPRKLIRQLVSCCKESGVHFKTIPGMSELIDGTVAISHIKKVEIEDLLGRDPVRLDEEDIARYIAGKRVLVTGAAGSIGSEICRQVSSYSPAKLVLLDSAETPLYQIEKELAASCPNLRILPIIADVRNRDRISSVFDTFIPEVVFHAAAYKHVPMMEYNPVEAVSNNVGGTMSVADAAHACGVENFVLISTDKAVNPTNVMGATKRAAELYVQGLAQNSRTCFTTVRFGNVLGSNGSVIPLFKEQILKGGPVTVTDERVIRYFMTIPEACQLVLQAGCMGTGGDIFLLDMGEPVRILDLAEELIRLSGLTPYEDIEIVFTGLRPGEKLFEELLIDGEGVLPTTHDKIRILQAVNADMSLIQKMMTSLVAHANATDLDEMMKSLHHIVPEFTPKYHFSGEPSYQFTRLRPDICSSLQNSPERKPAKLRHRSIH